MRRSTTARAAICDEIGPNAGLVLRDIDLPELGPTQVLIEVHYAAVNLNDTIKLGGTHHERPQTPFTPGGEISGTVIDMGTEVSDLVVGDRVAAMLPGSVGGWATRAIGERGKVIKIPDEMPFEIACGFAGGYLTAYDALVTVGQIRADDCLVVTGAAGGVGLAGIQIARALGAQVIAIAGGDQKCALAVQSGADIAINHQTTDIVESVLQHTNGQGASIVMEVCGGDVLRKAMKFTGFDGRVIITGFTSFEVPDIKPIHLLLKGIQLRGAHLSLRGRKKPTEVAQQAEALFGLYAAGKLKPHISRTFPLAEAPAAIGFIKERRHTGKVVITMNG